MDYLLKQADEGLCSCGSPDLRLLQHKKLPDGYPAFLICFECRTVVVVQGDSGQIVQYKGGRRRKFTEEKKYSVRMERRRPRRPPPPN